MLKISIITVNLNNAEGLQKTFNSVFQQDFGDFEYLVIDGGSTDGSEEIIKRNAGKISYWISEKDKGIYNAMNKGIAKAAGEYLLFLNSGDHLEDKDGLSYLIKKGNNADIIYGDILLKKNNDDYIPLDFPAKITFQFFLQSSLPHASALIKKSLFSLVGLYNDSMKIAADWEFFLLALNKYNCTYQHVKKYITVFDLSGISAQPENKLLIQQERTESLHRYFPMFLDDYNDYTKIQDELSGVKKSIAYRIQKKLLKLTFLKQGSPK